MTPPLPGSGPGANNPVNVDMTLVDRMVLAALGLRAAEKEPHLQKNAALFQGTSDPKIRAFKVHLAEDVFGRLAQEAVVATKDATRTGTGLLWALGTELAALFEPIHPTPIENRANFMMTRVAKRKLGVLSPGTRMEEDEDAEVYAVLKKWVDLNRDAKLAYLEAKIKYSHSGFAKAPRTTPAVQPAKPIIPGPENKFPTAPAAPKPVTPAQQGQTLMSGLGGMARVIQPGGGRVTPPSAPSAPAKPAAAPGPTTRPVAGPERPPAQTPPARPIASVPGVAPQPAKPAPKQGATGWRFMKVKEDELDQRPYTQALGADVQTPDGLPIVAAAVRGRKHKHEGTNCDDGFRVGVVGPWTILAISDGAGSCRFSRVGSKVACEAAVQTLQDRLAEVPLTSIVAGDIARDPVTHRFGNDGINAAAEALHEAMRAAYEAIEQATQERRTPEYEKVLGAPIEVKDLSCTLLLALHLTVEFDGKKCDWVMGCQVGDGMIAAVSLTGSLVLLASPDTGEFSGETDFITSKSKLEPRVLWARTQGTPINLRALMAMSDGLADDYFPNNPGMLRLFGDLCLNGVVQLDAGDQPVLPALLRPDAEAFSTVCDRLIGEQVSQPVRVYSFENYAKTVNKTVEQLLDEPHELLAANAGVGPAQETESQQLVIWMDSYQVRGSFDDRALAMIYRKTRER